MSLYSLVLFAHIVGALGLFVALGIEWTALLRLRGAATVEQAREWLGLFALVRRLGPASLVVVLLAGMYLAGTTWGFTPWIGAALVVLPLLAVLGAGSGWRLAGLGRSLAAEQGTLSARLRQRLRDPLPWTSVHLRAALLLGVVFLMVTKPSLQGVLFTLLLAAGLGLAFALPAWNRARAGAPA